MTHELHNQCLTDTGIAAGTNNLIGDYSSEATIFWVQPPAGVILDVYRLLIEIADTGSFDADSYGNGITLTNGIQLRKQNDSGTMYDFTAGGNVVTNANWGRYCYDHMLSDFGSGANYMHVRWTFARMGMPLRLNGDKNERLEVVLHDDFSGLVRHHYASQGVTYPSQI